MLRKRFGAVGGALALVLAADAVLIQPQRSRTLVRAFRREGNEHSIAKQTPPPTDGEQVPAPAVPPAASQARENRTVTIFVPGVVAYAEPSAETLSPLLLSIGGVELTEYAGDRFDADEASQTLANAIEQALDKYQRVNIIAESMGGVLTAKALGKLPEGADRERIRLILNDSPAGPGTFTRLSWVVTWFYPGPLTNALANFGAGLVNAVRSPFGGYPGPIHFSWSAQSPKIDAVAPGLDKTKIRERKQAKNAGYSLTLFADEARFLRKGLPPLAGLKGVETTYLQAQPQHDYMVVQPRARRRWEEAARAQGVGIEFAEIPFPAGHCDYDSWPEQWMELLGGLLGKP
jgi:pimeloyl-ACP methyl ester carboxylesterase